MFSNGWSAYLVALAVIQLFVPRLQPIEAATSPGAVSESGRIGCSDRDEILPENQSRDQESERLHFLEARDLALSSNELRLCHSEVVTLPILSNLPGSRPPIAARANETI